MPSLLHQAVPEAISGVPEEDVGKRRHSNRHGSGSLVSAHGGGFARMPCRPLQETGQLETEQSRACSKPRPCVL